VPLAPLHKGGSVGSHLRYPTTKRFSLEVTDISQGGEVRLLSTPTFSLAWDGSTFSHTLFLPTPPAEVGGAGGWSWGGGGRARGGGGGGGPPPPPRAIPLGGVSALGVKFRVHPPSGMEVVHVRNLKIADVWDGRNRVSSWSLGGAPSVVDPPEEGGMGGAYVYTSKRNYLPLCGVLRLGVQKKHGSGSTSVLLRMLGYQVSEAS